MWKRANLRKRHEYQYLIEIINCQKTIVIEITKIKITSKKRKIRIERR